MRKVPQDPRNSVWLQPPTCGHHLHEVRARFFCILSVLVCSTLCLCSIGNVLDDQGKPDEALAMHQKSLDIKLKVFGSNHPLVANTKNNIALIYQKQAKYLEALQMHQRSLKSG